MTTEQLAKLIADRMLNSRHKRHRGWAIEHWELQSELEKAILDLNLVQAEPVPEGAVPVVVYVGVGPCEDGRQCVLCSAVDKADDHEAAKEGAFSDDDTHRVRLEGYALPVSVPTVRAKAVMPSEESRGEQ